RRAHRWILVASNHPVVAPALWATSATPPGTPEVGAQGRAAGSSGPTHRYHGAQVTKGSVTARGPRAHRQTSVALPRSTAQDCRAAAQSSRYRALTLAFGCHPKALAHAVARKCPSHRWRSLG